jgi:hypothetical protein
MGSIKNNRSKRITTFFLPFIFLLLSHSSVYAEWTMVTPPNENQYWEVARVYFTSANEGWAVGDNYGADIGALLHYQNGTWTMVTPSAVSGYWALYGVYFTSANEGWAVGWSRFNDDSHSGVLLHYQNGVWTAVSAPTVSWNWGLYGVHFTSVDEGWAVGRNNDNLIYTGALLYYSNGTWTPVTPPTLSGSWYLNAVHFTSADEGWAVGYGATEGVLLHYQNGTWTPVTPPALSGSWGLEALHFTSADEGWAVGSVASEGVLLHYQSGTWTPVTPPTHSGSWYLSAVHFTSADEGWAVGRLGSDYSNYEGVLLHYQSGTWTSVTPPTMNGAWGLGGIHFTSADEGWVVGGDYANIRGALLRYVRGLSPPQGTIGTEITIRGSGFGFKKGKVFISGVAAKVNKGSWGDDRIVSLVTKVPPSWGPYTINVIPYRSTSSVFVSSSFYVKNPELDLLVTPHGKPNAPITITGRFFSSKKGKVYIEDPATGKKKMCKVTYWYMNPANGNSTLTFLTPKLPKNFSYGVAYPLKIINKVGTDETTFTVDSPTIS